MQKERRMILELFREGKITVEETELLLGALGDGGTPQPVRAATIRPEQPRRILVNVTENGRQKVNIKLPFSLIKAGLKLGKSIGGFGARYAADENDARILESLQDIDMDEIMEMLNDGEITLPYRIVDVDSEGAHAEIVLE